MMTIIWTSLLFMGMVHAYPIMIFKRYIQLPQSKDVANPAVSKTQLCPFPFDDPTLAFVTPKSKNAGWAMGSDALCLPGKMCPYVCRSGYVASPLRLESTGPSSTNRLDGSVLCDSSGKLVLPSNLPLCVPKDGNIHIVNLFDEDIFYCQKISIENKPILASNGLKPKEYSALGNAFETYGSSTSYYYLSPPGVGSDVACLLGAPISSRGDWSPYTLEITVGRDGLTFLKLGWNHNYITHPYWRTIPPNWGVRIKCEGPDCHDVLCAIDPSRHGVNDCDGKVYNQDSSAFCLVKVSQKSLVSIVLFSEKNLHEETEMLEHISSQYQYIFKDVASKQTSTKKQDSEKEENVNGFQRQELTTQESQNKNSEEYKKVDKDSKKSEETYTTEKTQKSGKTDEKYHTISQKSEHTDQELTDETDAFFKQLLSKSQQKDAISKQSTSSSTNDDSYMGFLFLGFPGSKEHNSEKQTGFSEKSYKLSNSHHGSDKDKNDSDQLSDVGYISSCFGKMAEICSLISQKVAFYSKASTSKEQLAANNNNKTETRKDRFAQESSAIHSLKNIHPSLFFITIVMVIFIHFM